MLNKLLNLSELAYQVQQMPADEFAISLSIAGIASVFGAGLALVMLKRGRLIEDTPTSKIRSAAQGYVELEGIARLLPGDPILAPLSKKACAWWKYSIEHKTTTVINGRRTSQWSTVESSSSDEMFQLVDDTDDCIVDPDGATVIPNTKISWYGHSRYPNKAPQKTRWMGFGRYRYREERIEQGSHLYALGWFRTEGGLAHSFDESAEVRELLTQWKADQRSLLAEFDTNKDGTIDMDEWAAVRDKAIDKVRATHLERAVNPDIHVLCRPPRRQTFMLSTTPQHQLVSRSRRATALGLLLFLGSGSAAMWLATVRGLI